MKNIKKYFYERFSIRVAYLKLKMMRINIQFREKNILVNKKY